MNRDKKPHAPQESPVLQQLRHRLTGPGPWPQRFQRLAEAIAESHGVNCQECKELLDVYVDDELQGRNVEQLHPLIWQHLQLCASCREIHNLLAETLSLERQSKPSHVPQPTTIPRLSFLQPRAPDAPWITRLRPRLTGMPFSLTFSFNLSYLRTILSPPSPLLARKDVPVSPSTTLLLLSDAVPVGDQTLAVEMTASRSVESPDLYPHGYRLRLRATIVGTAPLPRGLWATLVWAGQARSSPVDDQGQADLGEVSLAALQEALETGEGHVEVIFEVRDAEG